MQEIFIYRDKRELKKFDSMKKAVDWLGDYADKQIPNSDLKKTSFTDLMAKLQKPETPVYGYTYFLSEFIKSLNQNFNLNMKILQKITYK